MCPILKVAESKGYMNYPWLNLVYAEIWSTTYNNLKKGARSKNNESHRQAIEVLKDQFNSKAKWRFIIKS